jgi:hypothetical protein
MHLYREHLARVEELQQQGETTESRCRLFQDLSSELLQQPTQGLALERSVENAAGVVLTVAQNPNLSDRVVTRQQPREQAPQPPPTPRPVFTYRF